MKNSISFSTKISVLSFALCCGVVSQHIQWTFHNVDWLNAIHHFWFFIVETCVPFFFIISGYLFFRTYQSAKWKEKLKSRVNSLLIPYLVWNVFYTTCMLSLKYIGVAPNVLSINTYMGGVISCFNSELSPLWFIKYLMVFILISPLMYYVLKNRILGVLAIVAMVGTNAYNYYSGNMQVPLNINANNWIMFIYQYIFFAIGSYAALCWREQIETSSVLKKRAGLICIIILSITYWGYISNYGDVITNHSFRWLWCIGFWFACDYLPEINVRPWMKYSFFIYCAHYIFVLCAQGVTSIIYSEMGFMTPLFQIAEYIWLPVITIYILIKTGNIIKKHTPLFWRTITGNRG